MHQCRGGSSVFNMSLSDQAISALSRGAARSFADWPDPAVPTFGAGVYTIWDKDERFIYVGMSGRGITAEAVRQNTPLGIYTRLASHASGRPAWHHSAEGRADGFSTSPTAEQIPSPFLPGLSRSRSTGSVDRLDHIQARGKVASCPSPSHQCSGGSSVLNMSLSD